MQLISYILTVFNCLHRNSLLRLPQKAAMINFSLMLNLFSKTTFVENVAPTLEMQQPTQALFKKGTSKQIG